MTSPSSSSTDLSTPKQSPMPRWCPSACPTAADSRMKTSTVGVYGILTHHWPAPDQVLLLGLVWRNKKFAGQMVLDQTSIRSAESKQFMHTRVQNNIHLSGNDCFIHERHSSELNSGEAAKTYKLPPRQCITADSPAMGRGEPCYYFNRETRTNKHVSWRCSRFCFN